MDVVLLAVATDEAAAQLVHRGVQDPEPLVRLGEDLLQRFDLQLQRVEARHFVAVSWLFLLLRWFSTFAPTLSFPEGGDLF